MNLKDAERLRAIYRKLKKHMSLDEKIWLLDFRGNMEQYEKRLLKLAKKYEIPLEEVKKNNAILRKD